MARPTWKGWIGFGLVHVPVQLYRSTQAQEVRFHMLHDADGARIKQKRVCSLDGQEVEWDHIVKGYEVSRGQHVIVTEEELETFAVKPSRSIEIEDFVDLDDIDPVFFGDTDYLVPEVEATKGYALLASVLSEQRKVGIARMTLRTRESLVAVRAEGERLLLTELHRPEEIVPFERVKTAELKTGEELNERERAMAAQLVQAMSAAFNPEKYPDESRARLKEMLRKKAEGEELVAAPEAPQPPRVVNLMDALKKSLEAREKISRPTGERRVRSEAAKTVRKKPASSGKAKG